MQTHEQKIKRISQQLRNYKGTKPLSLKKKAPSHEVPKQKNKKHTDEKIDVSDLNNILLIDAKKRICIAEPGVTFVELVKETLKQGLVPMTVPESRTITIGGAVAGCSIESMSYKYGGFHDSCLEYEVITAKGDVLVCNKKNKNKLLFEMMHGTFGTLGIISKLKFKLIRAKPYVKLTHEKYSTLEDYKKAIWNHFKKKEVDFMDGIIHSPKEYVLCIGNFVDKAPYTHSYSWTRVYFKSTKKRKQDFLKTLDYFFRYDQGITTVRFKSFIARFLFNKIIGSSTVLRIANKFHKLIPESKIPIIVDVFIPFSKMGKFFNWYTEKMNYFPLWCVPYKLGKGYPWISKKFMDSTKDELFLDIAIYGMKKDPNKNYYRMLEKALMTVGGLKTLISTNYYSEKEFWNIWNKKNYYKLKEKTDPDNIFRDLYLKTCKSARGIGN